VNLSESIRMSWRAITGHKLRSTLTTLGVIIGIASVIVFMVMGSGVEADIVGDIDEANEPVITVQTQTEVEGSFGGIRLIETPIYTQSDVEALRDIEGVEYVSPDGTLSGVQLMRANNTLTGGFTVEAASPQQFQSGFVELVNGSAFSPEGLEGNLSEMSDTDLPGRSSTAENGSSETGLSANGTSINPANVAVVNRNAAQSFSPNITVGETINISFEDGSTTSFTVVGVVNDEFAGPPEVNVYIPLEPHYTVTVETPGGGEERAYSSVQIGAASIEELDTVKERVETYFETESDARQLKEEDHRIEVQTVGDIIDQIGDIIDEITFFIGGIAAISLIVGSIGIANIMIVSVTERTRQIGIMKAVGALRRDIIQLFLVESVILGTIGAVCGVLVGLGVGYLAVSLAGWPMAYPVRWILIAVVVGVLVGIISGLYPAWRAAKVDPIEALRHE